MRLLLFLLLFVWELPQNLCGIGLIAYCRMRGISVRRDGEIYVLGRFCAGGVSLGEFVFVPEKHDDEETRLHELGHRIQSRMLGPLYLLIVGLPSVILCTAARYSRRIDRTYYEHFPENWADRLGAGIKKPGVSSRR